MSDATIAQLERFIKKIAQKFPSSEEPVTMTDIHIMLSQDTGELMAFDDNDKEITRCVVDEWINSSAPDFYDIVAGTVRDLLARMHEVADGLCILKPYSFILENDERVDGGDPAHGVVAYGVRHEQCVGQRVDGVEKQSRERRQHETKDEFMHGRRSERELLFAEGCAAHFASSTLKAIL